MLSQTGQYALRAMIHLAQKAGEDRALQAEEIADALAIPGNYLSKILHALTRRGLLISARGPQGGFRLAKPVERISLIQIVEVFDPQLVDEDRRCLLGRGVCSDENACPAHEHWKTASGEVWRFFSETSLGTLAGVPDGRPSPNPGTT